MPNLNYAEVWNPELVEIRIQETLSSPFITQNVRWLDAKTFHFTQMSTSGYKSHNRNGGWNTGKYVQTDTPFTLTHDRDVQFLIDKADVDETNATASIKNISETFERTQAAPETDALFFSRVAARAQALEGYHSETAADSYTKSNVFDKLKGFLAAGKLRRYKANGSLIMYVTSAVMDLLEKSDKFTRTISMTEIAEGGLGLRTRVTDIDGVPIMEVIDDERFYDRFDFDPEDGGFEPCAASYVKTADTDIVSGKDYYTESGGSYTKVSGTPSKSALDTYYEKAAGSHKINVLIATPETTKIVPKIASIYNFAPGTHTEGDGYLYQNRAFSDVFTFPNGKDGKIDSIYVDTDTAEYSE
nr:MAG TPA: major capsid protein [Caudoviricetes sp.]